MEGRDAAAARRHDRSGRPVGAERTEPGGELVGRQERATGLDEAGVDRRVDGRRDVARHRIDRLGLAAVARSAARVEQDHGAEPDPQLLARDHPVPVLAEVEIRGRPLRSVGRQLATGRGPGGEPTIEHAHPPVTEDVEHPPQPGGDPAADVVIPDDEVFVADAGQAETGRELGGGGQGVATRRSVTGRIGQIVVEIDVDGPRDVARGVRDGARPRPTQDPTAVDDPEVVGAGLDEVAQLGRGDERPEIGHGIENSPTPPSELRAARFEPSRSVGPG